MFSHSVNSMHCSRCRSHHSVLLQAWTRCAENGDADGASVMQGKHNGVAALLRRQIPHLMEQHCMAYREDLGIDDA